MQALKFFLSALYVFYGLLYNIRYSKY